jgi:hypothetical protein
MNPVTHQTIKLSKGRHSSPDQGACVMELASMLAGEPFSDHPKSACPVIGSFLRTYNDSVDDERRQTLYAYAAQVVGTRSPKEVARARAEYLRGVLVELRLQRHPWTRRVPEPLRAVLSPRTDMIPARAARAIAAGEKSRHVRVRETLDRLLSIGAGTTRGLRLDHATEASPDGATRESEPERVRGLG